MFTAHRVSNNILSLYDGILYVSIMDLRENILKARSNQPFKDTFRVIGGCKGYGGVLGFTILRLVNQIRDVVGDAKAKITVHKNCKLMLLPMSSHEILIGLVVIVQLNQKMVR